MSFSCSVPLSSCRNTGKFKVHQWRTIKKLVETCRVSVVSISPDESLRRGSWVKLICGASFEDVVDIRNLSLVYTLAGVDCIDCAADASVINAVCEGIEIAREIVPLQRPWVMISINDDEDLHFRKAEFDPTECPPDCLRPCEMICPANAISMGGVITERCYGCGRCFPVCPYDKIRANTYVRNTASTSELLKRNDVDAVEIHTRARHMDLFKELWNGLAISIEHLKLVAVSLPDLGDLTVCSLDMMYSIMGPHLQCYNLWQLDGRPMSGDIGRGATRETIAFAVRLAAVRDRPPGFLQLAGGTNSHTIDCLKKVGLFQAMTIPPDHGADNIYAACSPCLSEALIGGIAYGGYARKIVGRILNKLPSEHGPPRIEDYPDHLLEALTEALKLVGPVKCYNLPSHLAIAKGIIGNFGFPIPFYRNFPPTLLPSPSLLQNFLFEEVKILQET